MQDEIILRAVTARLTLTPVQDLPRILGFLASSLAQCSLEAQFADSKTTTGASSVALHKLKTRITSLLQDRTTAGRLTAAVLIKSIVDHGNTNILADSDVWARGLLTCLNKPDPVHVKKVYLAAITRIFVLTQNHPTLLREVTTPLLPSFITACLGLLKPIKAQVEGESPVVTSALLEPVLQCWCQLLPQHATVFRPFLTRIRLWGLSVSGDSTSSSSTRKLASRLLSLLISCAPKNTASQEWNQTAMSIISSAHHIIDQLYRAVIEEYEPNDTSNQRAHIKHNFSTEPRSFDKDQLGLGPWSDLEGGRSRLVILLGWLTELVSISTPYAVTVCLGAIVDLNGRLLAVTPPRSKVNPPNGLRYHNGASKEEKDHLWLTLPEIHTACLRLLQRMNEIYGQSILAANSTIINQVLESLEAMSDYETIRQAAYSYFYGMMGSVDFVQLDITKSAFLVLVEQCCTELRGCLPVVTDTGKLEASKDGFLGVKGVSAAGGPHLRARSESQQAAWNLLPKIIMHAPNFMTPRQSRIEMDRLSVLLDHKEAMLASVMRPTISDKGQAAISNLLPFLARSAPENVATEALLRPRMPVVQSSVDLAQRVQVNDPPAGFDDHDKQGAPDEDILSTLEETVDAMIDAFDNTKQFQNDSRVTAEQFQVEERQGSVPKKRTIEDIGYDDEEGSAVGGQNFTSREQKMPRLEKKDMDESGRLAYHAPEVQVEQPLDSTASAGVTSDSQPRPFPSADTASKAAPAKYESDSDDSEIPQIDPEFSTDEEESD